MALAMGLSGISKSQVDHGWRTDAQSGADAVSAGKVVQRATTALLNAIYPAGQHLTRGRSDPTARVTSINTVI